MSSAPILTLASGSTIRSKLLTEAQIPHLVVKPRVDEEAMRAAILAEGGTPRDLADALAEMKALKVSNAHPGLVLGCDQVLALGSEVFGKPASPAEAEAQLTALSGKTHKLLSALVLFEDGKPVWRVVGEARMAMRSLSPGYIADYVARNWDEIRYCVGCYQLESEGVRLFERVEGSFFTVLGLPLHELNDYLIRRGILAI